MRKSSIKDEIAAHTDVAFYLCLLHIVIILRQHCLALTETKFYMVFVVTVVFICSVLLLTEPGLTWSSPRICFPLVKRA